MPVLEKTNTHPEAPVTTGFKELVSVMFLTSLHDDIDIIGASRALLPQFAVIVVIEMSGWVSALDTCEVSTEIAQCRAIL